MKKELGILVLLVVLCVIVAIKEPLFLGANNLQNMAIDRRLRHLQFPRLGLIIITGGIDLSVGSMMALLGVLLSMMLAEWGWPWPVAVASSIALSMALSWGHGGLLRRSKIQPFIVTLCGLLFYRGLARFITNDETKGFGNAEGLDKLRWLAGGNLMGIPMPFVLLVLLSIVMWILLVGLWALSIRDRSQ